MFDDYDVPAGYRDADLEMLALEAEGNRLARRARASRTCPTCRTPNALSAREAAAGYQCNRCADLEEGCY